MSAKARKARTRRIRRQNNAVTRHGHSAKPRHQSRSGRTGKVMAVKLKSLGGGKAKKGEKQ